MNWLASYCLLYGGGIHEHLSFFNHFYNSHIKYSETKWSKVAMLQHASLPLAC